LRSFKGNHKIFMVSLKRSQNLLKFYGYKRKLKTVKERVHQIKSDKDQLTTTDEEAAQAVAKFFSRVFLNERDGHDTQSEELVQEEEDWNIIINEDTVRNLHCILLLHITHSSKVNCTVDKVNCTLCVRKHTILGPGLNVGHT